MEGRWELALKTEGAGKVTNLYVRTAAGTSQTNCAALCLNRALITRKKSWNETKRPYVREQKFKAADEVGCCKRGIRVPRVDSASHGVKNSTKT